MKTGVKNTGTFLNPSGYSSAARAFATALYSVGIDLTLEIVHQMAERGDHGWTGRLCENLKDREIPYKIKIIHLTPDTALTYIEKGKYNIAHLFWETDKLPEGWADALNKMQEVWTSSSAMADLFRASGVRVPIYWFAEPLDIAEGDKPWGKFEIEGRSGFMFYSISQWIERYNFKGLITAFYEAFPTRNDVCLLLKTYRANYSKQEQERIVSEINLWKKEMRIANGPKILFSPNLLTHDQIMKLHNTGDCYITASRGDGWNRPVQEALLMGKPVISTARGGIHEYLNNDLYFPISSEYVPVTPVPWIPYYSADQNWAEPDKKKLIDTMQWVFANQELSNAKGQKAKNYVKDTFNFYKLGTEIKKRLEDIESKL